MPNDIVVRPLTGVSASSADNPAGGTADETTAAPAKATRPASPAHPNPSLRLDAALGLVVIEFRDDTGSITRSIPSAQQLEAYRRSRDGSSSEPKTPSPGALKPAQGQT